MVMRATVKIKANKEYSNIPIIAVTSFARDEDKEQCLNIGFDDYLAKPYDINELLLKIKLLLKL